MSNIYLTKHGTKVNKDGGRIVISFQDGSVKFLPAGYADCFIVMACVQITYGAVMEMLQNGGSIIYLNNNGDIVGELGANCAKARQCVRQLQCYLDKSFRQKLAGYFVQKKILAQRNILAAKNKSLKNIDIKNTIGKLSALAKFTAEDKSIEKLMGLEGVAAYSYFDMFEILINGMED